MDDATKVKKKALHPSEHGPKNIEKLFK